MVHRPHETGELKNTTSKILIVLASASPRRKQLLTQAHIPFRVIPSRMVEPPAGNENPIAYARKLAAAKARVVAKKVRSGWVLGADTIVVLKGKIYGKPVDYPDACRILNRLQGSTHRVITGVAMVNAATGRAKISHAVSRVTMRPMAPDEVHRYARRHHDKAGAYAVQEKKDPVVTKISGSYTNVVGLPMELVQKLLSQHTG